VSRENGGGVRLVGLLLCFDAAALLILYPRIDLFSGGYLLLSNGLAIIQTIVYKRLETTEEIRQIFYAKHLDTLWDKLVPILGVAELAVFFEYSHGRLLPQLVQAQLQTAGLLLLAGTVVWLLWVDRYLVRHFAAHYRDGNLMTDGPYRYIRHPRYTGLLATRLALPLVFGSVVAYSLLASWIWMIRRRVRLEETHLTTKFGEVYTSYAARTPGLL
jgi:protein-S-isoprenylcysteine O-methyltransferase Ste14